MVVEPGEHRRERIQALGFTAIPLDGVHEALIAELDGELAAVFECVGHPAALGLALELVAPAGTIVPARARGARADQPAAADHEGGRILGAFAYRREDFERAIELLASGELPAADLITEVVPLARAQEMFDELGRPGTEQLKVLLAP